MASSLWTAQSGFLCNFKCPFSTESNWCILACRHTCKHLFTWRWGWMEIDCRPLSLCHSFFFFLNLKALPIPAVLLEVIAICLVFTAHFSFCFLANIFLRLVWPVLLLLASFLDLSLSFFLLSIFFVTALSLACFLYSCDLLSLSDFHLTFVQIIPPLVSVCVHVCMS